MRIISGSARGRKLATPRGDRVRPTADRVKEAIFNVLTSLAGNLEGATVLDIFAGTGNLGIEALSRGAGRAVFVDNHRDSAGFVRKNLEITGFTERSEVIQREAEAAMSLLGRRGERFDLVFLDPPYAAGLAVKTLEALIAQDVLKNDGVVVVETDAREDLPERVGNLMRFDRRTYGDTAVAFYSPPDEELDG